MRSLCRWGPVCLACALSGGVGCAASSGPAKSPEYFRSPTRDYVEPVRSASDGEILGADRQSVDDRVSISPTNAHAGVGWGNRYGFVHFYPSRTRAGHGVFIEEPSCEVPLHGPPLPGDRQVRIALQRAWQEARGVQPRLASASVTAEVVDAEPDFLSCQY